MRCAGGEVEPRRVGLSDAAVQSIWRSVERLYATGLHPAMVFCMRVGGEVVVHRSLGHASGNGPQDALFSEPVVCEPDTPFNLFSSSKVVTGVLMHHAAAAGHLDLDDRVMDFIPEFGVRGKEAVTLRDILSHRAGFSRGPEHLTSVEVLSDWDAIIGHLCALEAEAPAGTEVAYHSLTGGFILAEVLHRATGRNIQTYLAEEIREPLGFKYMAYGASEEVIGALARSVWTGPSPRYPVSKWLREALGADVHAVDAFLQDDRVFRHVIPSGNVVATADELCRFFEMLLRGGTLDGVQVMGSETVHEIVRPMPNLGWDKRLKLPMRYSAGCMLGAESVSVFGGQTSKAFGHVGYTQVIGWADPERDLSAAFLNSGKPIFTPEFLLWLNVMRTISAEVPRREAALWPG
jgi:CubicO group peptidase (beta-lactamase class C family)